MTTADCFCPRGHRWEAPPGFPDAETNTCPFCGSAPLLGDEPAPWPTAAKVWLGWFIVLGVLSVAVIIAAIVVDELESVFVFAAVPIVWLISLIIWGTWYMERKRTLAMLETCKLMGFSFTEALPKKRLPELGDFTLFGRGHSHKAHNLMAGRIGDADVLLLDYQYVTGHGKTQQTHNQTLVLLPGAAAGLPPFQLAPATFMDKLGKLFGSKRIEFPETPEFSKRYRLTGPEEAVRPLFTEEARLHFLERPGWAMETLDGAMLIYRNEKRVKPENCPQLVADALVIRNLFVAWEEESGEHDAAGSSEPS
jgi:hypothetical protein